MNEKSAEICLAINAFRKVVNAIRILDKIL